MLTIQHVNNEDNHVLKITDNTQRASHAQGAAWSSYDSDTIFSILQTKELKSRWDQCLW